MFLIDIRYLYTFADFEINKRREGRDLQSARGRLKDQLYPDWDGKENISTISKYYRKSKKRNDALKCINNNKKNKKIIILITLKSKVLYYKVYILCNSERSVTSNKKEMLLAHISIIPKLVAVNVT